MTVMKWTLDMSVGLKELDQDHQVLIGLINELEAGHGQKDQAEALQASFQHLRSYAAYHFGREEAVLRAVGYDTLAGHQAEHRAFEEKIEALALKLAENPGAAQREINDALLDYLRDWLRHHILVIDMSYKELVKDSRAAQNAAGNFKAAHQWWGG